eukprot:CCRYP_007645-RA/>CCRYP_007645-RA protein AED:0.26 eAED:0.42 QI:0/0/0.5/1/0/0/2/194/59
MKSWASLGDPTINNLHTTGTQKNVPRARGVYSMVLGLVSPLVAEASEAHEKIIDYAPRE